MRCESCGQKIPSARSLQQHKLYWSCISFLFIHQKGRVWEYPEDLHDTIKVCIRHVKKVYNSKGEVIGETTRPTNFKQMTQDDFNKYFEKFQDFVWREIIPKHDENFEREWCNLTSVFSVYQQNSE